MTPDRAADGEDGRRDAVPADLRLPGLPGLRLRTCRGQEDAPALAEVLNADSAGAGIDEHVAVAEVAAELAHASEENSYRTLLVAELDGRVVGFARRAWHDREVFVAYEHVGFVHPDAQRRGLGRALLRRQAAALADLAASHATEAARAAPDPSRDRVLFSWADERRLGATALLVSDGYDPVRWYLDMLRPTLDDLPPAAPPPGIRIAPAGPGDERLLRAALAAEEEAFADHWGHHPRTAEEDDAILAEPDADPALWWIGWDGDAIAGVVRQIDFAEENARFGRRRIWIDRVSVRRPWRGRGIARALMLAGMAQARDRGYTSAGLGVDADNPTGALGLYERLGFVRGPATIAYAKALPADPAR